MDMLLKQIIGIFALAMIVVLGVSVVSAYRSTNKISEGDKEILRKAMDSGDYESWEKIKKSQISEDRFEEMRLRHQERAEFRKLIDEARQSGDYSEVQMLKTEFGPGKGMQKRNAHFGECPFMK